MAGGLYLTALTVLLVVGYVSAAGGDFKAEMNLKSKLLGTKYDRDLRPRQGDNTTTTVYFGVSLIYISELDEKNEILKAHIWMKLQWRDFRLAWNPNLEGQGISTLRIPASQVWTPDISLYNSAVNGGFDVKESQVIIDYNGTITWTPSSILSSYCELDLTYYPIDTQSCHLVFGSWSYDLSEIRLDHLHGIQELDVREYHENSRWNLVKHFAVKGERIYPCCAHPYADITYFIELERDDLFYSSTLVLPCVMVLFLLLLVFWLPPDSQEKITLGCVSLLVLALFMVHMLNTVPTGPPVPHVVTFYIFTMVMLILTLVVATLVVSLFHRGPKRNLRPVPCVLRFIFIKGFGCLLCLRKHSPMESPSIYTMKTSSTTDSTKPLSSACTNDPDIIVMDNTTTTNAIGGGGGGDNDDLSRYIAARHREQDDEQEVRDEWKLLAYIIDRLFFWIYLIICLLCIIALFAGEKKSSH